MKKIDLIYFKITTRVVKTAFKAPETFYGCKTNEDVLMALGSEKWGEVLCEVGYSPRFYITEVKNMSKRFISLFDKVVAMCDEDFVIDVITANDNKSNNN